MLSRPAHASFAPRSHLPLGLVLALACATHPVAPGPGRAATDAPLAATAPPPPALRLPDVARPLRQAVDLHLSPTVDAFTGSTDIDIELRAATPSSGCTPPGSRSSAPSGAALPRCR